MKFTVVLSNDSSNALYVGKLRYSDYTYILIVDEALEDDKELAHFDDLTEAEKYADSYWK